MLREPGDDRAAIVGKGYRAEVGRAGAGKGVSLAPQGPSDGVEARERERVNNAENRLPPGLYRVGRFRPSIALRWAVAAVLISALLLAGCGADHAPSPANDAGIASGKDGGIAPVTDGGIPHDADTGIAICEDVGDLCGSSTPVVTVKDVVTIGDSYMNLLVNGLQQSLQAISGHTIATTAGRAPFC